MTYPSMLRSFLSASFLAAPLLVPAGWTGRVARAEAPTHAISKTAPQATVGVAAKASVTVQGLNGWHVNGDAPITLTAKAEPGVELPKPKLARADLAQSTKETARFDIPFSASTAGKKTITAEARFVMCQEQACKPVKETVALEIDVASAAAAASASPAAKTKGSGKAQRATP
ncbi:MAG: hypothetical protein ABUL77_02600 [Bacteroidota bacterium]